MIGKLDLWDYATASEHAEVIFSHLQQRPNFELMPPQKSGGPWPEEWLALFKRWMDEGKKGLDSGRAHYVAERDEDGVLVTAEGQHPHDGYVAWFDRHYDSSVADLILYVEERRPSTGQIGALGADEFLTLPPNQTVVRISDATGTVEVPIRQAGA
jgi:hypothetical protein